MRFSERTGRRPVRSQLQIESMDDALRNRLWNVLWDACLEDRSVYIAAGPSWMPIVDRMWADFFNNPIDEFPGDRDWLKRWFFQCEWFEVYDLVEFVVAMQEELRVPNVEGMFNLALEEQMSGYRLVSGQITPITDEVELAEIEEAMACTRKTKVSGAAAHLESALAKLSDRKKPDYRNCIKESISAVESLCRVITGQTHATLGSALKTIEAHVAVHPALKKGFSAIYGYTSDADGVRHAMLEESDIDFTDAKYMLVSCCAFVNYLVGKAAKAGVHF